MAVCATCPTLPCLGGQSTFTLCPSVQEPQAVNRRGKKPESSQASGKVKSKEGPGGWREQRQAGFSRLPGSGWVEFRIYNQHEHRYQSSWQPQLDVGAQQYSTTPAPCSLPHPSSSADRACFHSPSNLILQAQSTQMLSKGLCSLLAKTSSLSRVVQLTGSCTSQPCFTTSCKHSLPPLFIQPLGEVNSILLSRWVKLAKEQLNILLYNGGVWETLVVGVESNPAYENLRWRL